jgi:acetate kinase
LQQLATLSPLAPLHQPHNLAAIAQVTALRPRLPQIACFDTAFHHSMPMVAHAIALPASLTSQGVRRYGFHGLSYEFIAGRLRQLAPDLSAGRIIAAHLGSGASMCAMANGVSVDSSMGFTALDGLMMATRCGSLDPGVVLYLQQQLAWTPSAIEDLLYRRAGLLGVSGESGDMRRLLDSSSPTAAAAVQLFVYRALREIGSLSAALQGLDGLVFTAGIGENSPRIRQQICAGLGWLGVRLDQAANAAGAGRISSADSAIAVWVIPTDEQKMIARHCRELVPV